MGEFPDNIVRQAWARANGRCECPRSTHGHYGRYNKQLVWGNRGREGRGAWETHHRVSQAAGGELILSNCEILCWDCHSRTL